MGRMPAHGTVCEVESRMFGEPEAEVHPDLVGEDRELLEAVRKLSKQFEIPAMHLS